MGRELAFGDIGDAHHFFLKLDDGLALLEGEHEGVDHVAFGNLLALAFDHRDGRFSGRDHDVHVAVFEFGEGGIDYHLAVDSTHPNRGHRAFEGDVGQVQSHRGADGAQHVRGVLPISRQHQGDDLSLIAPALGEHGPDGSVGDPRRHGFHVAGATFSLEKAAGDLAGCCGTLSIVHGQGHEVHAFADLFGCHGGGQHHGVAVTDEAGRVSLAGHSAHVDG